MPLKIKDRQGKTEPATGKAGEDEFSLTVYKYRISTAYQKDLVAYQKRLVGTAEDAEDKEFAAIQGTAKMLADVIASTDIEGADGKPLKVTEESLMGLDVELLAAISRAVTSVINPNAQTQEAPDPKP